MIIHCWRKTNCWNQSHCESRPQTRIDPDHTGETSVRIEGEKCKGSKSRKVETHHSNGNGQDQDINDSQNYFLIVPEVLTPVHIEPENGRKADCIMLVNGKSQYCKGGVLNVQLNQLPNSALYK